MNIENFTQPKEEKMPPPEPRISGRIEKPTVGIPEGDVFDPEEELRNIFKLPSHERVEAKARFKEKLAYQKEQLVNIQRWITEAIWKKPDITPEHFDKILHHTEKKFKLTLTEKQLESSHKYFEAYKEKHDAIQTIRGEHPDDAELYQTLFDKKPEGRIQVVTGPVTLYFRCYDLKDYAPIYNQTFISGKEATEEELRQANASGGVSIGSAPEKFAELKGTLIAENTSLYKDSPEDWREMVSRNTMAHEEQHAIKRMIFGDKLQTKLTTIKTADTEDPHTFDKSLRKWLTMRRERVADIHARDEILAFLKQGMDQDYIYTILTTTREDGGLYDYLGNDGKRMNEKFTADEQLKKNLEDKVTPIVAEAVSKIYSDDYKKLLRRSLDATALLKSQLGYGVDRITALLIHEPLMHWEKVTKRLLADKKEK